MKSRRDQPARSRVVPVFRVCVCMVDLPRERSNAHLEGRGCVKPGRSPASMSGWIQSQDLRQQATPGSTGWTRDRLTM